ncbi:MAG: transposase [Emticicia sp.]
MKIGLKDLYFQLLPPYCSELNKIETLWHHIKQLWLKIYFIV